MLEGTFKAYTLAQIEALLFPWEQPAVPQSLKALFQAEGGLFTLKPGIFVSAYEAVDDSAAYCLIEPPVRAYYFAAPAQRQTITLGYGHRLPADTQDGYKIYRNDDVVMRPQGTTYDQIVIDLIHLTPAVSIIAGVNLFECAHLKPDTDEKREAVLAMCGSLLNEIHEGGVPHITRLKLQCIQLDTQKGGDWNDMAGVFAILREREHSSRIIDSKPVQNALLSLK